MNKVKPKKQKEQLKRNNKIMGSIEKCLGIYTIFKAGGGFNSLNGEQTLLVEI